MALCKYTKSPILTIENLAKALRLDKSLILDIANSTENKKYREPSKPAFKSDGTKRRVMSPNRELRTVQKKINDHIFRKNVKYPPYLFGSVPRSQDIENSKPQDYIAAALVHCGAKTVCKLDISNFFDNIHKEFIKNIFLSLFKFSEEVSEVLTKLVIFENHLVQGALTSSFIAMLIFWDVEPKLVLNLEKKGIQYSRLVDDITLSSKIHNFDFDLAVELVSDVLKNKNLSINKQKKIIKSISTEHLTVHGLNINFSKPCLPKDEAKRIRSAVRHLEKTAAVDNALSEFWYRAEFYKVLGRVYKLQQFGKNKSFKSLLSRVKQLEPTASKKDLRYTRTRVKKLTLDYKTVSKRKSYSYKRRFNITLHRIVFIKKTYPEEYKDLKITMNSIKPEYPV